MNRDCRRRLHLMPETLRILRGDELRRAHAGNIQVITIVDTTEGGGDIVPTSVKCKTTPP